MWAQCHPVAVLLHKKWKSYFSFPKREKISSSVSEIPEIDLLDAVSRKCLFILYYIFLLVIFIKSIETNAFRS